MRIVIYGAGGIGGTIGARLHKAGYPVHLIARGDHGALLQERGLRFVAPDADEVLRIPTSLHPNDVAFEATDVILLCMKTQHTAAALEDLRGAGVTTQAVVCAQNGVANERMALRRFPNVYAMLVFLPALFLTPGEVVTNASELAGILDTGRFPGGVDDTAQELTSALTEAGFGASPDERVMRKKYAKLLSNLNNSLSALTDFADGSKAIAEQLRAEALSCYDAAGIDCAGAKEIKRLYSALQLHDVPEFDRPGGSSWQSVMRGTGNIEVDYLNGEIVQLGRRYGVPTPANWVCQDFAVRLSREGGQPGSVAVAELASAIERVT